LMSVAPMEAFRLVAMALVERGGERVGAHCGEIDQLGSENVFGGNKRWRLAETVIRLIQ
jgi:hypothetical protein